MTDSCRKPFQFRSFTSFVMAVMFLWVTFTGLVLYIGPPGGVARRTGWTYAGLGRDGWMAQHLTSCAVFLVAGLIHICLNRRALWAYIHTKARRGINRRWELLAAGALTALLIAGTIYDLPPWSWVLSGSRHLRSYRAEAAGQGQAGQGQGHGAGQGEHKGAGGGQGARKGAGGGSGSGATSQDAGQGAGAGAGGGGGKGYRGGRGS